MKYLIDTNVLSEARRPGGHPRVRELLSSLDERDLYLSVITIGEIVNGVDRLPPGERRETLTRWLSQLEPNFADRILPIDLSIARRWGALTALASQAGRMLHPADGLIAATALEHGMTILTRNKSDFDPTGARVLDPSTHG